MSGEIRCRVVNLFVGTSLSEKTRVFQLVNLYNLD